MLPWLWSATRPCPVLIPIALPFRPFRVDRLLVIGGAFFYSMKLLDPGGNRSPGSSLVKAMMSAGMPNHQPAFLLVP
jgi:hypothetical protein